MFYVKVTDQLLVRCKNLDEVQQTLDTLGDEFVEILIKKS